MLGTCALWDLITGFMSEYPFAVGTFSQEKRKPAFRKDGRIGSLADNGVLLHLAIACNDMTMLNRLFQLATSPDYQSDQKLSHVMTTQCAMLYNRATALQCIKELPTPNELVAWSWMPTLMCIALRQANSDMRLLDWLSTNLYR